MAESNPVTLPRKVIASKARISDPGYNREAGADIRDTETNYLNTSIKALRAADPIQAIRSLSRYHGVFSTAVHSYVQLAMSGYTLTGYQAGTHQQDPGLTAAAEGIVAGMDTLYDYTIGYGDKQSMNSMLETLLKEVVQTGACCGELVLNKFRLPEKLIPVPTTSIEWKSRADGGKYPVQIPTGGAADPIPLDIPTFFYQSTHQQSNSIFARSPMEAALQTVFVFGEFIEDMYRLLRKSGHSRMVVTILQEQALASAPPEIDGDPEKLAAYLNSIRTEVESLINGLEPDEAIVTYDTAKVELLKAQGEKADYTALLDSMSGMLATSLKSMPSTLGLRISGSQSLSNTESLVFLKMVTSVQAPVETMMSRALTLASRLLVGTDGYVKFRFKPVDIRPESELSAHRSVDMQNILRKLSLGFITDEEAAHLLGTGPRPPGAPPLSGTMFMDASGNDGEGSTDKPKDSTGDGAQERTLSEGTKGGSATSSGGGADGR